MRSWSGIGNVNYSRFDLFQDNYNAGKVVPLDRMLSDDKLAARLEAWRAKRTAEVAERPEGDGSKGETAAR